MIWGRNGDFWRPPCVPSPHPTDLDPHGDLSVLNGEEMNGEWSLTISDNAGGDQGTFNTWSLHFIYDEGPVSAAVMPLMVEARTGGMGLIWQVDPIGLDGYNVYRRTADKLLESGEAKSKEDINDALVIGCGWPAGIYQASARTGWKGKAQGEGTLKDVPNGELIVRKIYADMLAEARVILETGVAASEEDIDTCMKHGFRHPKGPFEMTAS